jgi:epoxyqueuosine reductase
MRFVDNSLLGIMTFIVVFHLSKDERFKYPSKILLGKALQMLSSRDRLKKFALSRGADLVGIASVDRFREAPEGHRPTDILRDARSVVVCAKRFPGSVVTEAPGTSYYKAMTVQMNQLDLIACELAMYIERQGGKAIPVPADDPYYDWDQKRHHGRGDLSHKHAAQAAGLGRLGKNSLLITPEFGNRVHLVSIVTSLDLDPDPLITVELCRPACTLCMKACPVKAIKDGLVNQKKCRSHVFLTLPKGFIIEACRECRKVCPMGAAPVR